MTKATIALTTTETIADHAADAESLRAGGMIGNVRRGLSRVSRSVGKYVQLTKPGIVLGNLVSVVGGFLLASKGHSDILLFLATTAGVALVIASGCAFNNYIDRDIDVKMRRTQKRIMVRGSIPVAVALVYASVLGLTGVFLLAHFANALSAALVTIGFVIYVGIYSLYMKRNSVFGTLIGSFSGAMPPVIGYCAVTGRFDLGAALLFAIFSLWQMPHSYAIAILHISDYSAAGIPVLPVKKGVASAKLHILFYTVAFTAAALSLSFCGYTGKIYLAVTAFLGAYWLYIAIAGYKAVDERAWARKMFIFSVICITALSLLMSVNYRPTPSAQTNVSAATTVFLRAAL